jgi:hypothetical protein
MNRRSFLLLGALSYGAILVAPAGGARGMKLPTSTLTVYVLSVDSESLTRHPSLLQHGQPYGSVTWETTTFVAKAQIQKVLNNEHDLRPGAVIEIRYDVSVRQPPLPPLPGLHRAAPKPGETVTLTVWGSRGGANYSTRRYVVLDASGAQP